MFLLLACVQPKTEAPPPPDEDTGCTQIAYHADADGDGFGDPASNLLACAIPSDGVLDGTDCDDADATVFPGATEPCDDRDNNCDGVGDDPVATWFTDADGDGFGDPATGLDTCDGAGRVADGTDCDDVDASVNPGAAEACDLDDDNCDGRADVGVVSVWHTDTDGDGYGHMYNTLETCDPPAGYVLDGTDCRPGDPDAYPGAAERCNDDDDDCDTLVDEDMDADGDGYQNTGCPGGDDCDDADADVHPDAVEVACSDGVDADCDGIEACGYFGDYSVSAADVHLWSTSASSTAGRVIRTGDTDGDGTTDLVVNAITLDGVGAGFVVPGPLTSGALSAGGYTASGDRAISYAGRSIGVGDLDGDGVDDVAWGSPYADPTGLWVTRGPITGDIEVLDADLVYNGNPADCAGHGSDLADVTGDGQIDLILGAYYADDDGINSGSVYVFDGPAALGTHAVSTADATITSGTDSELVGRFLAAGRDTDGDGIGDLLVGAPYMTGGAPGSGGAYVVLGPPTDSRFTDGAGALLGESPNDAAGESVALGDINGDGLADAILGSNNSTVATLAGAVYVVFSPITGDVDLATADVILQGDRASQYAGWSVAAGDVDADGDDELLIGGKGDDTSGASAGASWLFVEATAGTWSVADADGRFLATSAGEEVGGGVSVLDVNDDGRADLLIGATADSTGARAGGGVYIFESP